jgi:hypothetical protein
VPNRTLAGNAAQPIHNIMAGYAGRLVYHEKSIHPITLDDEA